MPVYKIVPLTSTQDQSYRIEKNIDLRACRSICNKDNDCSSYQFSYPPDKKGDTQCSFFNRKLKSTSPSTSSTLYIKNGNQSYWILWLFLAVLFLIVFFSRCGKKRF